MGVQIHKASSLCFRHFWILVVALPRGVVQSCWSGKLLEGIGHGVRKYVVDHKPKPLIAVVFSDAAIFQISRLFWRHVRRDSFCAGWSSMPPFLALSRCIDCMFYNDWDTLSPCSGSL